MNPTGEGSAWPQVLDAYDARLGAVRAALAAGDPASVPPFTPPEDLGPLSPDLTDRATDLLARSRELETLVSQARETMRQRLEAPAPDAPAPRRASRLDVTV